MLDNSRPFNLVSNYKPTGDQPQAIEKLVKGIEDGKRFQVLLGATGTGKTFTMANIIQHIQKPTLVLVHNIQMFSKNSHGYRAYAHTVRVKDLLFYLYYLYVYVFGQWTVMDSSFLKSLTGTARTCGTRDKFRNITVHYCPPSRYKRISVTPVTPVTLDFRKVSRVLRTCMMHTGVTRTHLHGTREKFTHYSVTGVTEQNTWVGVTVNLF